MSKSRPFSVYLLKKDFDANNALEDGHNLQPAENAANLPKNGTLYILNPESNPPWWRNYFGIQEELWQQSKGAILFLPVGKRCFALTFGHVMHCLKDESYEYDFGLIVTLNIVDPKELKSADMVEPGPARRKRMQVPVSTELTYLDFDGDSEIIKSLTGKVKAEYAGLFKNATGSSSLKVGLKIEPYEMAGRCEILLELYEKDDYKTAFPNIQNIVPVKDPRDIKKLDALLLESVQSQDGNTTLAIPDIVDYRDNTCCMFKGPSGDSEIFPDITIEKFYEYLGDDFDFNNLTIDDLRTYRMMLTDVDAAPGKTYGFYRSLLFEISPADEDVLYHFCEGNWYRVETSFVERLRTYIDAKCEVSDLCAYDHDAEKDGKAVYSEGNYNKAVPAWEGRFICLDRKDISPSGNTAIEPCDLYTVKDDKTATSGHRASLYHVKISTRSSQLSHLFNQGVNSVELIELEETSREKMKKLVTDNLGGNDAADYLAPFEHFDLRVVFGVITHKSPDAKSANLPLFSQISLMRNMQRLDLMQIPTALTFITDKSPAKGGHGKHKQFTVVICVGGKGNEVHAVAGQGIDENVAIKRCPTVVRKSQIGTKYKLVVKEDEDGSLSSYHGWPYELSP